MSRAFNTTLLDEEVPFSTKRSYRHEDLLVQLLRNARRAFVDQQIAHCHVGVTQVGTEKRFTKEIDKLIARRMTAEELLDALPLGSPKVLLLPVSRSLQGHGKRRPQLGFLYF